jgi:homocysteine S-methyltransferase
VQFLDVLADRPLLGDGAMGTMLHAQGVPHDQCFESINLQRPEQIRSVHEAYIAAGSLFIETNTFGANADLLGRHGHAERVAEINLAGARLARMAAAGRDVFVAGSIGPISAEARRPGGLTEEQIRELFRTQAQALVEGDVDLLILETFTDLRTLRWAYEEARAAAEGRPVITQMAFLERSGTFSGDEPSPSLTELWRLGADVVGVNCGRGPKMILEILEEFAPTTGIPISAFFNSGSPDLVNGRHMYLKRPDYLASMAEKLVGIGVNLLGGCCGTTPDDIACIAGRLHNKPLHRRLVVEPPSRVEVSEDVAPTFPRSFLDQDDQVPSVIAELDPPRGLDYEKVLVGAQRMAEVGIDMVSVAENPLASPRMGNLAMALLMKQHCGVEPLVHFTCRDRNLIGLQSDIMGAYAMGLRHILCITGDPVPRGGEFGAKGVYDVVSFGLIQLVDGLNRGRNAAPARPGRALGKESGPRRPVRADAAVLGSPTHRGHLRGDQGSSGEALHGADAVRIGAQLRVPAQRGARHDGPRRGAGADEGAERPGGQRDGRPNLRGTSRRDRAVLGARLPDYAVQPLRDDRAAGGVLCCPHTVTHGGLSVTLRQIEGG